MVKKIITQIKDPESLIILESLTDTPKENIANSTVFQEELCQLVCLSKTFNCFAYFLKLVFT